MARAVTGIAPTPAGRYRRLARLSLLALLPVLAWSVISTGRRYLDAAALHGGGADGWRDHAIVALGVDTARSSAVDVLVVGLVHLLPVLVLTIIAGGVWERVFAVARGRPFDPAYLVYAVLFTLLCHPAVPLGQALFGLSFGLVFAYAVFGGAGRTFLNPALVGVVAMQVSFPGALTDHPLWTGLAGHGGTTLLDAYHREGMAAFAWSGIDWGGAILGRAQGLMGETALPAILVGGAILVAARLASIRIIAGAVIGIVLGSLVANAVGNGMADGGLATLPWHWHLVLGGAAFGVVFLATDPSASTTTNAGRWIQGILTGLLVVLLRVATPAHADAVYPAILMVSMLAPLIDHGVVAHNIRRRHTGHAH